MKNTFKKNICIISLCFSMFFIAHAQSQTRAEITNQGIALRCLEQASLYSASNLWEDSLRWSETGIQYDSEIPDLWYIKALADFHLEKPKSEILISVESALQRDKWLQFNKSAARLLYANLLSDTLEWYEALAVLNEEPMIQVADADYIRAKTYYRLGNLARAREIIKNAVNLFPHDARFAILFFKTERTERSDSNALNLAAFLVNSISLWQGIDSDILLYASPFITNHEERSRLLKTYYAQGGDNELYSVLALNYGIISEQEAFSFIQDKPSLDYSIFSELVSHIQTEEMKILISQWLNAFDGELKFDTNEDGIIDLIAEYERGRPSFISYDKNQDNEFSWKAFCDFGSPTKIYEGNKEFRFSDYPEVDSVMIATELGNEVYSLNAQALKWAPVSIKTASLPPLMEEFFIPVPNDSINAVTKRSLLAFAGTIVMPTEDGLPNGLIRFSLLNGRPVSAVYTTQAQPYAFATFENGILKMRNIDTNLDGTYDLTEFYSFNPDVYHQYLSTDEQSAFEKKRFGNLEVARGLYISKVTADLDGDGSIDYSSDMLPYNGFETRWFSDNDFNWSIGYAKRPVLNTDKSFSGNYVEESTFINPMTREETTVIFEDATPVLVRSDSGIKQIIKDELYDFYWIGEPSPVETERILQTLSRTSNPTVSIVKTINENTRILAVKVGDTYFGEIF